VGCQCHQFVTGLVMETSVLSPVCHHFFDGKFDGKNYVGCQCHQFVTGLVMENYGDYHQLMLPLHNRTIIKDKNYSMNISLDIIR
jgi:hypothetical protein